MCAENDASVRVLLSVCLVPDINKTPYIGYAILGFYYLFYSSDGSTRQKNNAGIGSNDATVEAVGKKAMILLKASKLFSAPMCNGSNRSTTHVLY